jgi:S1-C subfamily serine protease
MTTSNDRPGMPVQGQQPITSPNKPGGLAILTIIVMLIVVLGVGGLGGWLLGRNTSVASVGSPSPTPSTSQAGSNQDAVRVNVVAQFRPSVVQINVTTQEGKGSLGSGTIIDSRGYIVTNDHVVTGARSLQIELFDGEKLPATLIGLDPLDDLAVVKITPPAHMAVASLGDSSHLQVGQTVLAIGNPLGITQTVTSGIVSALNRNVPEGEGGGVIFNAIQMDAPINPGNSGGALVDLQGDLIGIPTLTIVNPSFNTPASGVGFSIPANRAAFIVPQLIQSGKVTKMGLADLGLAGTSVDAPVAALLQLPVTQGVLVSSVDPNGPAGQVGLKADDIIVRIDDTPVTNESALLDNVLNRSPGEKVALQIYRGNQRSTVNVTLGKLQITP